MSFRAISDSEINLLMRCQAAHDMKYVGQLAGDALSPKTTAPLLREGKAWGHGVAALHSSGGDVLHAHTILSMVLEQDAEDQRKAGVYMLDEHEAMVSKFHTMLVHYQQTTPGLQIKEPEYEILVPLPALNGHRRSNRYRLHAFIDGIHLDENDRLWLVEYKLRTQLTPLSVIVLGRQIRWYAWAYRELTGVQPVGVIVDERLNAIPSPVKINQPSKNFPNGVVSKVQSCTPEAYIAACQERDQIPDEEVLSGLMTKRWSQRQPVVFRDDELDEVGKQLKSAARQVRQFDRGDLFPIRNPSQRNCPGCAYREICGTPRDRELVDALFERVPSKRDRVEVTA